MSTTAEYYIRNMSTTEFEGFYNRLRSTDRAATIQKIREEMDRGLARAMAEERLLKQITADTKMSLSQVVAAKPN